MNRERSRTLILAAFILPFCTKADAQIELRVRDARDHLPLPGAHVSWTASGDDAATVTDGGGRATLAVGPKAIAAGVPVRITYVGFDAFADTIRTEGPFTCLLRPSSVALNAMVVTAQYQPVSAERAVHRVRVIDAERIQRSASNDLGEALRHEPNVRLAQDNFLGSSMSMRGLGGENVKILIDGVPVIGRQNGNVDLSQIDLNGIERIEVVEGPMSATYGTNALAGTVNLVTRRRTDDRPAYSFGTYAATVGQFDLRAGAGSTWGRHAVDLNAGRDFFTGWDPSRNGLPELAPAPADSTRHQQWKPREQYHARLRYRFDASRWALGATTSYDDDRITDRGAPRAPYQESAFDQEFHTVRFDHALTARRSWDEGSRIDALIAHERYTRRRTTLLRDLTTLDEQLVADPSMQDTSRFTLSMARAVFTRARPDARIRYEAGVDLQHETGSGDRMEQGEASIGDHALFGSLEYAPVRPLTIRPAIRLAHNTAYDAPVLPSINARWQVAPEWAARASYASGFRAPGLKELHFQFVDINHQITGNDALKAERSNSWGASLNWSRQRENGRWGAELSGSYDDVRDMIVLAQVDGMAYTYANVGAVRTGGLALSATWGNEAWRLEAGTAAYGRDDAGSAAGWLWSGEGRMSATRDWVERGWSAQVYYRYQGTSQGYAFGVDGSATPTTIAGFHAADASVAKHLWQRRLRLAVGCKNLFDVRDVAVSSTGGVHADGSASTPMMTGRSFFFQLDLALDPKDE